MSNPTEKGVCDKYFSYKKGVCDQCGVCRYCDAPPVLWLLGYWGTPFIYPRVTIVTFFLIMCFLIKILAQGIMIKIPDRRTTYRQGHINFPDGTQGVI